MRLLLIVSVFLIACRTHTIPIGSMPAYAANQPVVTREGRALSIEDGGTAVLVPRAGHCLSHLPAPPSKANVIVAGEDPSLPCRTIAVRGIEDVVAGPRLIIDGKSGAVEVDPELVTSVVIKGPKLDATDFAPKAEPRSTAMIVLGSLLIPAGIGGSIALFTAASEDNWFSGIFYGIYGVVSLGAGLGGGIPLIVIGARPVRAPMADQPRPPGIQLSGLGLHWVLE